MWNVSRTVFERQGALLEASQATVAQVIVDEPRVGQAWSSLSGANDFSNDTTCEPGNASTTAQMVAVCSGVISLRSRPV